MKMSPICSEITRNRRVCHLREIKFVKIENNFFFCLFIRNRSINQISTKCGNGPVDDMNWFLWLMSKSIKIALNDLNFDRTETENRSDNRIPNQFFLLLLLFLSQCIFVDKRLRPLSSNNKETEEKQKYSNRKQKFPFANDLCTAFFGHTKCHYIICCCFVFHDRRLIYAVNAHDLKSHCLLIIGFDAAAARFKTKWIRFTQEPAQWAQFSICFGFFFLFSEIMPHSKWKLQLR